MCDIQIAQLIPQNCSEHSAMVMRGKAQRDGRPSVTQFSYHVPTSSVTNPITTDTPWCEVAVYATWATAVLATCSCSICLQLTINTCRTAPQCISSSGVSVCIQ